MAFLHLLALSMVIFSADTSGNLGLQQSYWTMPSKVAADDHLPLPIISGLYTGCRCTAPGVHESVAPYLALPDLQDAIPSRDETA